MEFPLAGSMDNADNIERGHSPSLDCIEDSSLQLPVATTNTDSSQHHPASSSTSVPPAQSGLCEEDCEKNPNIPESSNPDLNDIYTRFSRQRKRAIVAVVSFAALLARTSSLSHVDNVY